MHHDDHVLQSTRGSPLGHLSRFHDRGSCYRRADRHRQKWISRFCGRNCNRSVIPRLWGSKGRATSKRTWNKDGQQNGFSVNSSKHSESREVAAQRPRVMDLGWALRHGINQKLFALWRSLAHGNEAFWTWPGKGPSHEAFEHGVMLHMCSYGLSSREIDRQTTDWTDES